MAQTNYTPISLYYSTTASAVPTAANLVQGELAINTADGKLYYEDSAGVVQVLATKSTGSIGGSNTQVQFNNSGSLGGSSGLTWDGSFLTTSSIKNSALTSGRVTYAGTAGLLQDSANLLYSGTDLTVYGLTVGRGPGASIENTTVGSAAFSSNSSGTQNVAVGRLAMQQSTSSSFSVAVGNAALQTLSTGSNNTAAGTSALQSNTTASNNTAVGYQAGYSNTTGAQNVFVGRTAGYSTTTATSVTALGDSAGYSNTTGNITSIGFASLINNTTGSNNTAVGESALRLNTTASNNTAVGYQAGYSNTTGTSNVFMGWSTGYNNSTGSSNTFIGIEAGRNSTSGSNTFIGTTAGYSVTTGIGNTFIGGGLDSATVGSGYRVTTGSKNTILGNYDGNQGGLDIRTSSNNVVLSDGDSNIAARWANGGGWFQLNNAAVWSITSDERIKKNVVSLESGLSIISALRPVEFDYIKDDKHDIGFIAQEYQKVLPAQISEGADGMLSLNQNLVPYLVKAIQELKAEFDAYKATHP